MARSLLLPAALATAALALHMSEDVSASLAREAGGQGLRGVPHIADFREIWERRYAAEEHLHDEMPPSIQLVLGIFTVAPDVEYREVVRRTWLNQTGVCYWQRDPVKGCSVYVAFVVGREGVGERPPGPSFRELLPEMSEEEVEKTHSEPGMLVLGTIENLNRGKSSFWFDEARLRFPWATHVGKADMDTYPFLHKLVHRMDAGRGCSLEHSPYEMIGRPHNSYSPYFKEECTQNSCPQFASAVDYAYPVALPGQPWRFLSGELYVLSMRLVDEIDWDKRYGGLTEDLQVTLQVRNTAQKKAFCVVLRRLDAWYHNTTDCNATYANDGLGPGKAVAKAAGKAKVKPWWARR